MVATKRRTRTLDHLPKTALLVSDTRVVLVKHAGDERRCGIFMLGKVKTPNGKTHRIAARMA